MSGLAAAASRLLGESAGLAATASRLLNAGASPANPMTLQQLLALPPARRPMFVVSDGMGRDSTAMLIGLRRLGLRPVVILHADTGDEHPLTDAYRKYRNTWLRSIGFPEFTMVRRAPSTSGVTGLDFATLGEKCYAERDVMLSALAAPVGPPENQSGDGQERFAPTLHNLAIPRRPS